MAKDLKILIIGFGSIGQRHYQNLKKLGYKNLYVFDINKKLRITDYPPAGDPPSSVRKIPNRKLGDGLRITKLNSKTLKDFDLVFICAPNNLHLKYALLAAKAGCHLFIEKPLSHNLKDADKLEKIIKSKKLINMVACNMRFHPCLRFAKKYMADKKLGKIYSIHHEFGYYLPSWRPGSDYTKNYAAKRSTGGGIILDDIHEFDLLFWLNNFKPVQEYKVISDKISNLKIETEDACVASFKFNNKVLGSVRCDYLQQSYSRNCKIAGERGNLEWDFRENIVWLKTKDKSTKLFQVKNWDANQMYIDEIKYFMACVKSKRKTFNDIKTAREVLKYCINK